PSIPLRRPDPTPHRHSFPTRRSSDLACAVGHSGASLNPGGRASGRVNYRLTYALRLKYESSGIILTIHMRFSQINLIDTTMDTRDRKSTRLNSSHVKISYAVFCLKKK